MNTPTKRDRGEAVPGKGGRKSNISASQRAAVIITLLGESAAKPIVQKLDDAALAKVVTAIENISTLAREELVEIVIDFLTQLRQSSGSLRGGPEKAREVMSGVLDPGRMNALFGSAPVEMDLSFLETADVWTRLAQREAPEIAEYLGSMTPNIIALVLRKLNTGMVSSILCLLPDEKVSPTLGYMVEAPKIDPSIEPAVERMIEIEFLNKDQDVSESNDDHLGVIGEVLSLIPAQKRNNLIDFLRTSHEAKLPIIEKGLFTIDALPEILPRNAVNVVFRQIDNAVMVKLLASLRDTYPPILEFLLSNISSRMADSMREEFKDMPAFSVDQVETLQREFLTTLMDLSRRGLITMNRATDKNDEASVPLPG